MQPKKPAVTILDGVILAVIIGFFGYIWYRLFFSLNYKWNWGIIPTYLFRFDADQQRWTANILLEGFFTTIKISVWATIFAVLLGFTIGLMRVSPRLFFQDDRPDLYRIDPQYPASGAGFYFLLLSSATSCSLFWPSKIFSGRVRNQVQRAVHILCLPSRD